MRRSFLSVLAGGFCFLALASCTENPSGVKLVSEKPMLVITPTQTLDQSINALLDLFPKEMREHDDDRRGHGDFPDLHPKLAWYIIKLTYAAGLTHPALMTLAKKELFWLSDWITKNAQKMNTPPNGETQAAAAARLVRYMSIYVYAGPSTPTPSYAPAADATVGTVTPTAPATVVTPTLHAGVKLDAGSVAENTVIVVTQNPTPYPKNCSGPLTTKLCQYPQFYTFEMFPHKRLQKPATFNVCHVNSGANRHPLPGADHDHFKIAHTLPANPDDRTPGSIVREGNGENIEILQLVPQTFSTCTNNTYASNARFGGPLGVLSRLAKGLQNLVTPKTAYAIDVGLGGLSVDMSPFNVVDSLSTPDISVQSVSVAPASVHPGDHVSLSYSVTNIGTATRDTSHATILLTPVPPGPGQQLGTSFEVYPIAPGDIRTGTGVDVVIPASVAAGNYQISLAIDDDPTFPDANLLNNSASTAITITPNNFYFNRIDLGVLPGDQYSDASAVNSSGQVVGYSGAAGHPNRAFIWQNGGMSAIPLANAVDSRATGINERGDVVGVMTITTGEDHAFLWTGGQTVDLGTLPGATNSIASGINSYGQVVGWSQQIGSAPAHAWIWFGGSMTDLGVLPGETTVATAINDTSMVVGYSNSGAAWVYQWSRVTFLGALPSGSSTSALAINISGQVVGSSTVSEGDHPFLWNNGEMIDLGTLGGTFGRAAGIGDDGRVVGSANLASGVNHAFIWQNGHMNDLGTLSGPRSNATGIKGDWVSGNSSTAEGFLHAVLWNVGTPP